MWVPTLPTIAGDSEEKLAAAATTRALCELPALQEPAVAGLWGQLLAGELRVLASERPAPGSEESPEEPEEAAGVRVHRMGYKTARAVPTVSEMSAFSGVAGAALFATLEASFSTCSTESGGASARDCVPLLLDRSARSNASSVS